jgi:hypothetical protein
MSVYPRKCECCNPAKEFKNRQDFCYHLNRSKTAQTKLIQEEMNKSNPKVKSEIDEPLNKKAKVDETEASKWLNSKLDLFLKLVVKNHGDTDLLDTNISVLEEDIDEDLKGKISELCFELIAKWDQTKISHPQETFTMGELRVK